MASTALHAKDVNGVLNWQKEELERKIVKIWKYKGSA